VAMIPAISESFAMRDRKAVNEKIVLAIRVILLVALPSCIGLSVLSYGIFDLLFPGSPYGGFILCTFSYATIFMMLSNTFQSILQSIDRFRIPLVNLGVAIILRFITGWIFLSIPFFNIQGIVISSMITFIYLTVANYLSVKRFTHIKVDFVHTALKPLLAAVVMGIAVFFTYKGIASILGGFLGIIIAVMIGVFIYSFTLVLLKGITEDEIKVLPGSRTLLSFFHRLERLAPGRKKRHTRH
ncbi:MAG: polysaccharide biosynthesis C-terminal domain-containing protein, partial [Firmicutes bacterium]|nr:polysaccharide biosynthesis C-terminal domain-containing protein [Bacillota bacterium]